MLLGCLFCGDQADKRVSNKTWEYFSWSGQFGGQSDRRALRDQSRTIGVFAVDYCSKEGSTCLCACESLILVCCAVKRSLQRKYGGGTHKAGPWWISCHWGFTLKLHCEHFHGHLNSFEHLVREFLKRWNWPHIDLFMTGSQMAESRLTGEDILNNIKTTKCTTSIQKEYTKNAHSIHSKAIFCQNNVFNQPLGTGMTWVATFLCPRE